MKKLHIGRLLWVVFIVAYSALFFHNCLSPFPNWHVPYVYSMMIVIWLSREYYLQRLFFQSGQLIPTAHERWCRAFFALLFYASLATGVITVINWSAARIGLYPVANLMGLALLVVALALREQTYPGRLSKNTPVLVDRFYLSTGMIMISLGLGFGSWVVLAAAIAVGGPLILLQRNHDRAVVNDLLSFVASLDKGASRLTWVEAWAHYQERRNAKEKK